MSPADGLDHLLLTRFNIEVAYSPAPHRLQDDWLAARLQPFEAVCAPSVRAQLGGGARWVVLVDAASPRWFLDRLTAVSEHLLAVPLDRPFSTDVLREALAASVPLAAPWLLTTRLDSDDALAAGHLARVRALCGAAGDAPERVERWIDHPLGLQLHGGALYRALWRSNPFLSRLERVDPAGGPGAPAGTALALAHSRVRGTERVQTVWGPPAWLQVIHGANASSGLVGLPRARPGAHPAFPAVVPTARGSWAASARAFAAAADRRLRARWVPRPPTGSPSSSAAPR